jgi:hypothetical protein
MRSERAAMRCFRCCVRSVATMTACIAAALAPSTTWAVPITFPVGVPGTRPVGALPVSVTFDAAGAGVIITLTRPLPTASRVDPWTAAFARDDGEVASERGGDSLDYEGYHEHASCDEISGWAWNRQRADRAVVLDIFVDGTRVDTVTADGFREDLLEAGKGNGRHGFTAPLPASLRDGKAHRVRVKVAGMDLRWTPREITCMADGSTN